MTPDLLSSDYKPVKIQLAFLKVVTQVITAREWIIVTMKLAGKSKSRNKATPIK